MKTEFRVGDNVVVAPEDGEFRGTVVDIQTFRTEVFLLIKREANAQVYIIPARRCRGGHGSNVRSIPTKSIDYDQPGGVMEPSHVTDIRLGGAKLEHRHLCAFFHSQDEEYDLLLPFIKDGVERGEKAFHIVNPRLLEDHFQRLERAGIDPEQAQQARQLEVRVWEQAYLRSDGCFDQYDMLGLIEDVLKTGKSEGFPLTRLVAHMEWSKENQPGVEDLVEYESRLNYVLPQYEDPVICVYDLAQFDAETVIDILRTHPMVILGGTVQVNPFYVPPDEFLQELRSRKSPA